MVILKNEGNGGAPDLKIYIQKEIHMVKGKRNFVIGILCVCVMVTIGTMVFPIGAAANTDLSSNLDIIAVEGADEKSEDALEELEENNGVILFAEESVQSTLKGTATDKVVLTYTKKIRYEDFFTRNYRVKYDGKTKIAYCVQPKEDPPSPGSWTAKEYNNKLMKKALYYAYGYPGYDKKTSGYLSKKDMDEDYEDDEGAYALSHLVLSYFYDKQSVNSDAFLGVSNNTKKLIKLVADKIENDWPDVPDDSTLTLNRTTSKATWDSKDQLQKTDVFKLKGHSDNRIVVSVPENATMYRTSDGITKKYSRSSEAAKTVKVYGGDSFYFTAASSVKGSYESGELVGNLTDFQPYIISVTGKQNIVFCGVGEKDSVAFSIEWENLSTFSLQKSSSAQSITKGNSAYSLQGAKYGIYKSDGTLYETVTTDANGKASCTLPYGTYTIKEVTASKGYALDEKKYEIKINSAKSSQNVTEIPQTNIIHMVLKKQDKDLKKDGESQGEATLEGAQYKISYYSDYYKTAEALSGKQATRSWIVSTDMSGKAFLSEDAKVSGDEFYLNEKKQIVLPLGTVAIQEIKAPAGYVLDKTVFVRQITGEGTETFVNTYNPVEQAEQVVRGDLKFQKKAAVDNRGLAGIAFSITSKSTGESKEIVTDENGNFSSTDSELWFGVESEEQNNQGRLIYDTYILEELRNDKNIGLQLIAPIEVEIRNPSVTVDLGELLDEAIQIHTVAINKETKEDRITAGENSKVQDSILYSGLEIGQEYTAEGILIDQDTGKPLVVDGKEVTGKTSFSPESENGVITVDFSLDSSELAEKSLVVYETLYQNGIVVAEHKDRYSDTQTIRVVKEEEDTVIFKQSSQITPKTGDNTNVWRIAVAAVAALLIMCIAVFLRRKKK